MNYLLEALQLEYWLSVGRYSVLSIRSSVRVVDVDVADVEVALVVVVVVCTEVSHRFGNFNKGIVQNPEVHLKKAVYGWR